MLIFQLIIIQIVAFVALLFVLRKVLIATSYGETKRLQQLSEEKTAQIQELAAKISEAERQYRDKIAVAEKEAKRITIQASEEAGKLKEDALAAVQKEKNRIVQQAVNAKEKIRDEVAEQMDKESLEFSCKIFQQALSSNNQQLVHEGFINEVLEELEKVDAQTFRSIDPRVAIEIITPHALSESQRKRLTQFVVSKVGKGLAVKEKIDRALIAGLLVKIGSFVIDGSLAKKIVQSAQHIRHTKKIRNENSRNS